jgi:X-Pro dipeptidyl-peptidase
MRSNVPHSLVALALVTAALAVGAPPAPGAFGGPAAPSGISGVAQPTLVLQGGVTKPVFSYRNAIRESVWVNGPDGDGDGHPDLVTADIVRPRELDGVAKVPVIMDASPYYLCCGRGNEHETKTYDAHERPLKLPLFYDNYFEPRGYAVVLVDMAGTARSTGCADEGAASDIRSTQAVIDWLNGRATAVDVHGNPATASWANGDVGLIGKSYDGTLAEGVAATGVEGLKTIVPISAISSWYDYDRAQGIPYSYNYPGGLSSLVESARTQPVDCSAINAWMNAHDGDETGDYTRFWSKRDYRKRPAPSASRVKASVFLVHGLQDTNVQTPNFARWLQQMYVHGVVTKVWLSRLGHVDPFDYRRADWVRTLNRWFDNQLMGVDNGVLDEPRVEVEISPGRWVTGDAWPATNSTEALTFHADGSMTPGPPEAGTDSFTNDPHQFESQAIAQGPNAHRLLYVSGSLQEDLRISGGAAVDLTIRPHTSLGQVGIALVDYGEQVRVPDGDGNRTLQTQSCWGKSTTYDDACYHDSVEDQQSEPLAVLARGWARLNGNGWHTLTVNLAHNDVVVPAGHQLGVAIFAASPQWLVTLDGAPTIYDVDLGASTLELPVVDTPSFGANAGDLRQVPLRLPRGAVAAPSARAMPIGIAAATGWTARVILWAGGLVVPRAGSG